MSSLLELIRQKKADLAAASGDRKKTIKPADGTSRFRILPSWRGEGQQFWHDFGQHFIKKDGTLVAVYMCADKTYGRPCSVCAAIDSGMRGASDDGMMAMLKEAKASGRVLLNAIDVVKTPNQVDILELSPTAFRAVCDILEEYESAGESVMSLVRGKDFLIQRTGTGLKTKYSVQLAAKTAPLPAGVTDMLNDLDAYVQQESEAQSQRALNAVRSVVGLLPAPGAARSSGLPAAAAELLEDDPFEAAPPPRRAAPVAASEPPPWNDVVDVTPKAVAAKSVPKAVAPAAAVAASVESTGDADLDALLADLS